jgi:hypothetical protein
MSTSHLQTPIIIRAGIQPSWSFRDELVIRHTTFGFSKDLIGLLRTLLWRRKFLIVSFLLKKGLHGFIFEAFYYRLITKFQRKMQKRSRASSWSNKRKRLRVFNRSIRYRLRFSFLRSVKRRLNASSTDSLPFFRIISSLKTKKSLFLGLSSSSSKPSVCLIKALASKKQISNGIRNFQKTVASRRAYLTLYSAVGSPTIYAARYQKRLVSKCSFFGFGTRYSRKLLVGKAKSAVIRKKKSKLARLNKNLGRSLFTFPYAFRRRQFVNTSVRLKRIIRTRLQKRFDRLEMKKKIPSQNHRSYKSKSKKKWKIRKKSRQYSKINLVKFVKNSVNNNSFERFDKVSLARISRHHTFRRNQLWLSSLKLFSFWRKPLFKSGITYNFAKASTNNNSDLYYFVKNWYSFYPFKKILCIQHISANFYKSFYSLLSHSTMLSRYKSLLYRQNYRSRSRWQKSRSFGFSPEVLMFRKTKQNHKLSQLGFNAISSSNYKKSLSEWPLSVVKFIWPNLINKLDPFAGNTWSASIASCGKFFKVFMQLSRGYVSYRTSKKLRVLFKRYWSRVFFQRKLLMKKLKIKTNLFVFNLRPLLEQKLKIRFEFFKLTNIFSVPLLTKQILCLKKTGDKLVGGDETSRAQHQLLVRKFLRRILRGSVDIRYKRFRFLRLFFDFVPVFYISLLFQSLIPLSFLFRKFLSINQRAQFKVWKFLRAVFLVEIPYIRFFCDSLKIQVIGRAQGKPKAQQKVFLFGSVVPLQTLSATLYYHYSSVVTRYGTLGVRFWLYEAQRYQSVVRR